MRKLTAKDVKFHIIPEQEDTPVRSGGFENADGTPNEELIRQIMDDSAWNEWAWCSVKVTAEWNFAKASAYLGCCSYKDREDFEKGGLPPPDAGRSIGNP